ncbi:YigZ family protein [Glaciimonas sp. PCH181]|uniref:IMPACT family protein n=1 Tax=Glaciimonas sp. PCH181 TaxID=2133943 RepID=UPI000D362451|nr:YigZ family protein [Glaciimonas sp. PCH181]PUA18054.1 IMPACT family protein [Glaciimonas sp. PCH181]
MAFTLVQAAHSKIDIKKSVFIGFVTAVAGRPEALAEVARLRVEHPNANHVCWALLAGGHSGASDDGEPGGTAGLPMLNVLRHQDLEQVLAVVVRYFGGIRLGAGGLVRAYTDAVAQALLQAEKIELVATTTLCAAVPYALEGPLRRLLQQNGATLGEVTHGEMVSMCFSLPLVAAPAFRRDANEACHGALQWLDDATEEM